MIATLLTFTPHLLRAQGYPLREYGVVDGLPQSQIHAIFQDSRDFLWIITKNGLSRFDGVEFINYLRRDGLPSNYLNCVVEDEAGTIWVVSANGLSRYTGTRFEFYPPPVELKSLIFINAFWHEGNLLVTSLDQGTGELNFFAFSNGIYSDYIQEFPAIDTLGITHSEPYGNNNGLLLIDKNNRYYNWDDNQLTEVSPRYFNDSYSARNALLAVSGDSIITYNGSKDRQQSSFYSEPYARFHIDLMNPYLEFFDGRFINNLPLPFNPLGSFLDSEDVLWIKSENNMFRLLNTSFFSKTDDEIGAMNLWAIAEDRYGHIWFGSLYGSLIEYDGKNFKVRNEHKALFSGEMGFFKGSRKMSNGDIWFSTDKGVLIWDGKKFSKLKGIPESAQVCYIYEDPVDKSVLVGAGIGLYVIKGESVTFLCQFNDSEFGVIEGILRVDNGRYLLSGHKGMLDFDGVNASPLREETLPEVFTYTLEKDPYGGIWVTSEEGLYFRSESSQKFIHGLPESINYAANSICLMDSSRILVGRGSDICIIDLEKFYKGETGYFRIYDKSDGFEGSDCIDNGIIKDRLGRFWILTSNNVVRFDPSRLKGNLLPPRLRITGLYFQNDTLEWEPVEKDNLFYSIPEIIKLKSSQNKILISFTGISTTNPEKVLTRYRLMGIDDKWSSPSSKRNVVYENLPPGNYNFELMALNADGVETPEPLTMALRVVPTIWQTLLFKILYILVSIILTVIFTALYLARRQRKKAEEVNLRTELSKLQMNSILRQFDPHFTFNVISSVGSLVMKGEKEIAYDYITKLSGLLRTVLSDGTFIVRPLADEIDFVRRYCELQSLRFKERFRFQIIIDESVDLQRKIPKMTIQTFVENSIKHGFGNRREGGQVVVKVCNPGDDLEILVSDDGVGRAAASGNLKGGSGSGIKLVRGLFDQMNSKNKSVATVAVMDLEKNEKPSGTEVRIFIPADYSFE